MRKIVRRSLREPHAQEATTAHYRASLQAVPVLRRGRGLSLAITKTTEVLPVYPMLEQARESTGTVVLLAIAARGVGMRRSG
ncbi:hypothetical protein OID55_42070 (plasmid) [Streptomyces sp. NBC_00715]|uniref:hypothetical protein n=1 Tax=Streptomyces sp. NBC_00715 TaxID=2975811 RepID=UPI002F90A705